MQTFFNVSPHHRQANTEIVIGTTQQETGARGWLSRARLMTRKHSIGHVVRRLRRYAERLWREFASSIDTPWTVLTGLRPMRALAAGDGQHLVVCTSWCLGDDARFCAMVSSHRRHVDSADGSHIAGSTPFPT